MIDRRRALATLFGVSASIVGGLTGCSGPRISAPSSLPTGSTAEQLDQVFLQLSSNYSLGVFIEDLAKKTSYVFHKDFTGQNASMAKPMIAALALRRARLEGTTLTGEQSNDIGLALRASDNDAAQRLWDFAGGGPQFDLLARELGMSATHTDASRPDQWSWTWTTPADQVRLLQVLMGKKTTALTNEERELIFNTMGEVQADQSWGIGAPKSTSVTAHLKNGWVQFKSTDNLWAVNSMGYVQGDGRSYRLAAMSRVPDFDTGRDLLNAVGTVAFRTLV